MKVWLAFARVVMLEQNSDWPSPGSARRTFSLYYPTQQELLRSLGVEWRDEYVTA